MKLTKTTVHLGITMIEPMTDEDLIDYCETHCKTEVALFHRDHVTRMFMLAGKLDLWFTLDNEPARNWFTVRESTMDVLVKAAREQL